MRSQRNHKLKTQNDTELTITVPPILRFHNYCIPQERKPQNHYITCIDGGLSCAFNSLTADWKYKNKSGLRRSENNMQVMNILKRPRCIKIHRKIGFRIII